MNPVDTTAAEQLQEQFGRRVAARLSEGCQDLPHEAGERLRAARTRALAQRKPELQLRPAPAVVNGGAAASLGGRWWPLIGGAVPIVLLAVSLVYFDNVQSNNRAQEVAQVDAALLTDELPTNAYTDPGFLQFLKHGNDVER